MPLLSQDGSDVSIEEATGDHASSSTPAEHKDDKATDIVITSQPWCGRFTLPSGEFTAATVGAKSLNTLGLQGTLPGWIQLPASVALPFGTFEAALEAASTRSRCGA